VAKKKAASELSKRGFSSYWTVGAIFARGVADVGIG
jgi:hypothetical protein